MSEGHQFTLCHPGTNQVKALDDWLATGLMIEWKSGFFSRRYLQLMPKERRASFSCRDERLWQNTGEIAHFQLVNAEDAGKRPRHPYANELSAQNRDVLRTLFID